jgi:hypothetical protein
LLATPLLLTDHLCCHCCVCHISRQWLFILEGLPSVLLGVLLAIFLPESPLHSSWITAQQKELFKQDVSFFFELTGGHVSGIML